MDKTTRETPSMTLQELVEEMRKYHAKTGAYRPEDVYRLVGDPRKGIGLSFYQAPTGPGCGIGHHTATSAGSQDHT